MTNNTTELPGLTRIVETLISGKLIGRGLEIDARYLDECAHLWKSAEFTELVLSSYRDAFNLKELDFLNHFPPIQKLHVCLNHAVNLQPLEAHASHLNAFVANDDFNGIRDFGPFQELQKVAQSWVKRIQFPPSMNKLESMNWHKYQSSTMDLSALPEAPKLHHLGLIWTKIESLSGIERYSELSRLSICYAAKLTDISSLRRLSKLKDLRLDGCKAVNDIAENIHHFDLETLDLTKCASLTSLSFIKKMPKLRSLIFIDTDVIDGDMHFLLDHPSLCHVAFTKKKHFSHFEKDILKALKKKS